MTETSPASPITFTERAAHRVGELIDQKQDQAADDAGSNLRVYVEGGGCSGFRYGFQLDDAVNEDDFSVVQKEVTMLVDSLSYQYLLGATVDYVDDLMGARFVVTNPNANSTCGCGASFSI